MRYAGSRLRLPGMAGPQQTGLCDCARIEVLQLAAPCRRHADEPDASLERYIARISRRDAGTGASLALPVAPLLALELRFVVQHRHDTGEGFIVHAGLAAAR